MLHVRHVHFRTITCRLLQNNNVKLPYLCFLFFVHTVVGRECEQKKKKILHSLHLFQRRSQWCNCSVLRRHCQQNGIITKLKQQHKCLFSNDVFLNDPEGVHSFVLPTKQKLNCGQICIVNDFWFYVPSYLNAGFAGKSVVTLITSNTWFTIATRIVKAFLNSRMTTKPTGAWPRCVAVVSLHSR